MRALVLQGRKLFFNFARSERCSTAVLAGLLQPLKERLRRALE
jgi:hypothetical protein